ncbi:MAG: signal peptidase I [Trueperaceae bacterium]
MAESARSNGSTLAGILMREARGYLGAFTLALVITTFLITSLGVAGSSMEPTLTGGQGRLDALMHGDRLFVPKYETWLRRLGVMGPYRRGEIIIAREPADSPLVNGRRVLVVKRVVGLPGDTVEIRAGRVTVNGVRLSETFITAHGGALGSASMAPTVLDDDEYFVLGDNRRNSADSRLYGPIEESSITGRAAGVIFPPRRDGNWNWRVLTPPETFSALSDAR